MKSCLFAPGSEWGSNSLARARGSGIPQGQFLDDQAAVRLISENLPKLSNGPVTVPVPSSFPALAIMPDGSIVSPSGIKLVPGGGGVKTAFPVP